MSPSSTVVSYRPEGAGYRTRQAHLDLALIPDPQSWLTERLGPLATFQMRPLPIAQAGMAGTEKSDPPENSNAHHLAQPRVEKLDRLTARLSSNIRTSFSSRRAALNALAARLEMAAPAYAQANLPSTEQELLP